MNYLAINRLHTSLLAALLVALVAFILPFAAMAQPASSSRSKGVQVNTSWWPFAQRVQGVGPVIAGERDVRGFNGVRVEGTMNVFISQGEQASVRVVTNENFMEHVQTNVMGDGVLKLSIDVPNYEFDSLAVYVTVPYLSLLQLESTCFVQALTTLTGSHLTTTVNGSACKVTFADGSLDTHTINLVGSGNIVDALKLKAAQSKLTMTGFGNTCSLNAEEIDLFALGIGSTVYYKAGNRFLNNRSYVGFARSISSVDGEK
jgi:hypothetical protein